MGGILARKHKLIPSPLPRTLGGILDSSSHRVLINQQNFGVMAGWFRFPAQM
jgi:hypothetical protein